jgi:hypothetical protein
MKEKGARPDPHKSMGIEEAETDCLPIK